MTSATTASGTLWFTTYRKPTSVMAWRRSPRSAGLVAGLSARARSSVGMLDAMTPRVGVSISTTTPQLDDIRRARHDVAVRGLAQRHHAIEPSYSGAGGSGRDWWRRERHHIGNLARWELGQRLRFCSRLGTLPQHPKLPATVSASISVSQCLALGLCGTLRARNGHQHRIQCWTSVHLSTLPATHQSRHPGRPPRPISAPLESGTEQTLPLFVCQVLRCGTSIRPAPPAPHLGLTSFWPSACLFCYFRDAILQRTEHTFWHSTSS